MTAPAAEVAPEVAAARAALDLIPAEWRIDALDSSVLQRAATQALGRALGERAAMAHARQDVAAAAITKVVGSDLTALEDLISAQLERDAAAKLRSQLTVPEIDRDALNVAFTIADAALTESDRVITLPAVSYDAEIIAWRQACAARPGHPPLEHPVATDLCRAASKRAATLTREVDETLTWHQNWRQWITQPGVDPLSLLASAAGVLEQRQDLAKRVKATAGLIGQANRQRRDAKLNWTPPRHLA